jgi:serine/threonine-protein kinase PpkA
LIGLPYKSQLMAISNELWNSWSMDEQDDFLNSLGAKIEAYKEIHDNSESWIALNEGDDPGEYVYPIILSLLP